MQKLNDTLPAIMPTLTAHRVEAPAASPLWTDAVEDLLAQAAALCVDHGVDCDSFMKGAWSAYIDSRPGLRDYLEDLQLRSQLEELRKLGKLDAA